MEIDTERGHGRREVDDPGGAVRGDRLRREPVVRLAVPLQRRGRRRQREPGDDEPGTLTVKDRARVEQHGARRVRSSIRDAERLEVLRDGARAEESEERRAGRHDLGGRGRGEAGGEDGGEDRTEGAPEPLIHGTPSS